MAHQIEIAPWILKNRSLLNPSFTEFDWPTRYFNGLHDFEAILEVDGFKAYGRGISENKEIALEKASAEAIERLICLKLGISSVGVAVCGEISSESHARFESLERYFFDEHVRLDRPFRRVVDSETGHFAPAKILNERFHASNKSGNAFFYEMDAPKPYVGTICNISLTQTPLFLGLAFCADPFRTSRRAFNEALANYAAFKDSPNDFKKDLSDNKDVWHCDPKLLENIHHLFHEEPWDERPIPFPELKMENLNISEISVLEGCPIKPVRCVASRRNST